MDIDHIIDIMSNDYNDRYAITEWSYQRFAKFYQQYAQSDEEFNRKINKIATLILDLGITDIHDIAEQSGCAYDECILKISYLKNKRVIGDYYIDSAAGIIALCSEEDQKLLKKYQKPIYRYHSSLEEMSESLSIPIEQVISELDYLDNKKLLNGIILDKIDKKIIYYSVEKHLKENYMVTINCQNCGAINDVKFGSKVRCEYCNTIIEDKRIEDAIIKIKEKQKK